VRAPPVLPEPNPGGAGELPPADMGDGPWAAARAMATAALRAGTGFPSERRKFCHCASLGTVAYLCYQWANSHE